MSLPATNAPPASAGSTRRRGGYVPPRDRHSYPLADLLKRVGRPALEGKQMDFLRDAAPGRDAAIFYAGNLDLLDAPTVSIVGTREVSDAGIMRPNWRANWRSMESRS